MRADSVRHIGIHACIFLFLSIQYCLGQTDADNHRKYWYYRSRLVNDFVKVGLNDGESMPFNQRGLYSPNGFADPYPKLFVGDGTSTLGYYIGVLATEYHLLAASHQDTSKVRHELFCALNAINRLDFKAEGLFQPGAETLNGFFIRDDIPTSLLTNNLSHFNYYDNPSRGFLSKLQHAAHSVESDWSRAKAASNGLDISMSQDQVYNLLLGIALVSKLVPETETDNNALFPYESGAEISLTRESRRIASRIIRFMRSPTNIAGTACGNPGNTFPNLWRIRLPTTCSLVAAGNDASAFAYPLSEINCQLNTQASPPNITFDPVPHTCSVFSQYYDPYAMGAGYAFWNLTVKTAQTIPGNPDDYMDTRVFYANLAAIGNCSYNTIVDQFLTTITTSLQLSPVLNWLGIVINWVYNTATQHVTTFVPGYKINSTGADILVNSYIYGAPIDHAPLARVVLHGGFYQHNPNYSFRYLLDIAPCDDIYNFGVGNQSTYEWSSDSRLDHPNRRGKDPVAAKIPSGEYNGIDYMLYHNLWYVHEAQLGNNTQIRDFSDVHIEQPSYSAGSIDAYETVTIKNTSLNLGSPTYMRAGKTVYFGPGTQVAAGSNLHAYIEGYQCATDTGHF